MFLDCMTRMMLRHWTRSLSIRIWLTNVAVLALSLTVLAALVICVFNRYPEHLMAATEQAEGALDIANGLRFDDTGRPVSVQLSGQEAWLYQVAPTELRYRVLDAEGRVLLASSVAKDGPPWLAGSLASAADTVSHATIDGKHYAIATQRVSRGQSVFYVQGARSEQFISALVGLKIKPIPDIVEGVFFVAVIIFGLTLPLTIRHDLRPLCDISDAAAHITPRNLTTRLPAHDVPREISPLIDAFNAALARLEHGFGVQQQFLAAAAHELQTPLTLIRGQIELQQEIEDKALLFREIDLMSRQVRQLLHLAEVSEPQNYSFGDVSGVDVAQEVIAYLSRKADVNEVRLTVEERETQPPIWADRSALFILLKNIVENAINVSPAKGLVALIVDRESIQVDDEGPGVRQEHLPYLFKRFWRAPDSTHDGAGLGLAICNEIALAHQWQLTVSSTHSGTRFVVWFDPSRPLAG